MISSLYCTILTTLVEHNVLVISNRNVGASILRMYLNIINIPMLLA